MNVRVLLFAGLSQRAGAREWEVEVADGTTVGGLLTLLQERHPFLRELPVAVARNAALARPGERVGAGDELALLPPVSGG